MAWRVFAAAAIGKSHIDGGTLCQDAFAHARAGDTLVAVVCDGAGSYPLSHIGSANLTRQVADALALRVENGEALARLMPEAFHAVATETIAAARTTLAEMASSAGVELSAYSATLVGACLDAQGGYFFHIGDGLAVAETIGEENHTTLSLPENGEYANETYFVSGEAWQAHLRITPIAQPAACLALMSDGAMPFVMAKGNGGLFRPFMDPVTRFLEGASEADGSQGLAGTLEDPRTWTITGDDKTLLVALWA